MNETVQDLKMELESKKNTQMEGIQEIDNLEKRINTSNASITNRIQEMEEYQTLKI